MVVDDADAGLLFGCDFIPLNGLKDGVGLLFEGLVQQGNTILVGCVVVRLAVADLPNISYGIRNSSFRCFSRGQCGISIQSVWSLSYLVFY